MYYCVCRCHLPKAQRQEAHEVIVATLESRSAVEPPWIGELLVPTYL